MRCGVLLLGLALAAAAAAQSAAPAPPAFTLDQALARARANSPDFQAALVAQGIAGQDLRQAHAAFLPSLNFTDSYLYTQGGRFIANNGVHEYTAQGNAHENLYTGGANEAMLRHAQAGQALADAQAEIAGRGLAATVTADYYGLLTAQRRQATLQKAVDNAKHYLEVSRQLEQGGEADHADVVKAELEASQNQADLLNAGADLERARLDLAVLLFPGFNTNYSVSDDLDETPPLIPLDRARTLATQRNPELAVAQAGLTQAQSDVSLARSSLLPSLGLDYWYGIDASHFAVRSDGMPALGSAAEFTLSVPVWNWGANQSKVDAAKLDQKQAQTVLDFTRKRTQADLEVDYAAAQAARDGLALLATAANDASEALRLVGARYEAGEDTILDLVDAQNTWRDAENAYDDARAQYRVALANLQVLTGRF